ncbi:MAG: MerR family transcriptional regulator [Chloroflexi bacterium]|nr:MAG: MerR family transcriptional regulator [Chloroflexota bacterium]
MNQHFYHTSQFAQKASVTIRTLRFYDQVGLLSPTEHTEAGYRLYTDEDFFRLQQILALKFLGFSLEEIKRCLQVGPTGLPEVLALQKAMLQEKREQIDAIIRAITETEELLDTNQYDWHAIIKVIQVMQMEQTNDWQKKYFTDEQLQQMEELSKQSYTPEQRQQLAEWGKHWTEADQQEASRQWDAVFAELKRLVAGGYDPASPEAQALVQQQQALIRAFTHGDPGIEQGLRNWYFQSLSMEQRPVFNPLSETEATFLQKATEINFSNANA